MITIILFLLVLTALVFVHELGHFLAARFFGVRVDEFAIGFPPRLFSKKYKNTDYSINLLPVGGYVKIYGENPEDAPTQDNLLVKPKWQQLVVLVAGVTFNIIFAWILLSLALMVGTKTSTDGFPQQYVQSQSILISYVSPNSPAATAGLKTGDEIINVTGIDTVLATTSLSVANIQKLTNDNGGSLTVTYKPAKGEEVKSVRVEPAAGLVEGKRAIGIAMSEVGEVKTGFFSSFYYGAKQTFFLTINIVVGLYGFFKDIVVGHPNFSEVAGPVGIANIVGDASRVGLAALITITAVISANLAVINLLPFPALDGGRIVVILIEAIRRKTLSPKIINYINMAGFFLLIALMVIITFKDILKLIK
ncbi:MAG: hypothetical protein RL094_434 [Candidatus Parcubacteria bacterium]|jgi:regulator of sigma E protease